MKKALLLLLTLILAVSIVACTPSNTTTDPVLDDSDITTDAPDTTESPETSDNDTTDTADTLESVTVSGIVAEILDDQILLTQVVGLNAGDTVMINIGEDTQWDIAKDFVKVGSLLQVELSPMMTRSIPPQSPALRILAVSDVFDGEIMKITEDQIEVKPVSDFYNHELVVLNLGEETTWTVSADALSEGTIIRVAVGQAMTMSIPPQVGATHILSIVEAE